MGVLSFLFAVVAAVAVFPAFVFLCETLAFFFYAPERRALAAGRPTFAVLVPAHNEAAMLAQTLAVLRAQTGAQDRLIVVADNCTDDTAAIARAAGAEVIERRDDACRGKGYALQYGIDHVAATGPRDVVIIVDADCRAGEGALETLARRCAESGQPVQGCYLMTAPETASLGQRFSEFAIRVRNYVRPAGGMVVGVPSFMSGSGMALPWTATAKIKLASGNLVEDMAMGLDLVRAGYRPLFEAQAAISSPLPSKDASQLSQRKRWEHGHLITVARMFPVLVREGVARRSWGLIAAALDLAVLPLSVLAATCLAIDAVGLLLWLMAGGGAVFSVGFAATAALAAAVFLAWAAVGRDLLSARDFAYVPLYVLKKMPIYLSFFAGKRIGWVRSDRS